jgi:hypothetical protein
MKSNPVASGQTGYSEQYDALRADAFGASQLLPHQQLGKLALPTNPSNTQTWTLTINGTPVSGAFVTTIGSTPGNVLIGASAAATAANLLALLLNPQTTNSTQVALSVPNQELIVYCGYALNGTSITIYSQNTATYAPETSFTASTTATGGSWTANTMALYIESGSYFIGTTLVKYAGGNTPTFTAPATNPRIDIVTLDSSGTLAVSTGTESASPSAPAYPANKLVVCEVFHRVSETIVRDWDDGTQGYVSNDSRPFLAPPYISAASQVATQIFIPWISSPAQGDVMYYNGSAWVRLAAGTNKQFLQTQGASANPQWAGANTTADFDANTDTTVSVPTGSIETTVQSGTVNAMNANDHLMIFAEINAGNIGTGAISLNGTDILTFSTSTGIDYIIEVLVSNRNSTSAQEITIKIATAGGGFVVTRATTAINLSSAFTLALTGKQNTGGAGNWIGRRLVGIRLLG